MSLSSAQDGKRKTSESTLDHNLYPPYVKHLEGKVKEFVREGDIEFPFEETTGIGDENRMKGNWSNRVDALLATVGFTFGIGNLWRFPFLLYKNGGSAFLVPFITCLLVAVVPIFFMEAVLGQFSSLSAISVWKVVPLFKGIGISMVVITCVMTMYLNVVSSWTLFYLFNSIGFSLPYACDGPGGGLNCTRPACDSLINSTCSSDRDNPLNNMPSFIFFHREVLMLSDGIDSMAPLNWYLGICLLLSCVIVFLSLFQGVRSSGKVAYVLVLLPLVILFVITCRLLTLDGPFRALVHFLKPDFSKIMELRVWGEASVHAFYSLSVCTGGLGTLSSYNRFHNNLFRDIWIVTALDVFLSIFACVLTFSAIGFTSAQLNSPIEKLNLKDGAHLLFVVLADALSRVSVAPLYAVLFFVMVFLILLSTNIFLIETIVSSLCDHYAESLRRSRRHVLVLVCVLSLLASVPFCSAAGMYWLSILDHFLFTWPLVLLAFFECVAIAWVYGVDNLLDNVKWMTGSYPPVYLLWNILWKYVCPCAYMCILSFVWVEWISVSYESYAFPAWAHIVGWSISAIPVLIVAVSAICQLCSSSGSLFERWRSSLNPDDAWGPALAVHRAEQYPLQIPEARRLLIPHDDQLFPLQTGNQKDEWTPHVSADQLSRDATAASMPSFDRETAI